MVLMIHVCLQNVLYAVYVTKRLQCNMPYLLSPASLCGYQAVPGPEPTVVPLASSVITLAASTAVLWSLPSR